MSIVAILGLQPLNIKAMRSEDEVEPSGGRQHLIKKYELAQ